MRYSLSELASATGGVLTGPDKAVSGAFVDSREAAAGSVFFAMPGSRTDGHAFVREVLDSGSFAVVSSGSQAQGTIMVRSVPDALLAAGAAMRKLLRGMVAAVTGSSGKTTTRELLALALSASYRVDSSRGNNNNRIGLPLSILNLDQDAGAVVLELGMNHEGELRELGNVARPDATVITNVGSAHIEFFSGHDALARAKAELLETTAPGGFCVIPSGEPVLRDVASASGLAVRTFGPRGDFWLEKRDGECVLQPFGVRMNLFVPGDHLLTDAAMAVVCAAGMGVDPHAAARAQAPFTGLAGRGGTFSSRGMTVVDESYNANPDSMIACLEALSSRPGRKAAILGDMLELGEASGRLHTAVLEMAAGCGLELLILVGPSMRIASAAMEGAPTVLSFADSPKGALDALSGYGTEGLVLLVKGSHSMGLDQLVEALRSEA